MKLLQPIGSISNLIGESLYLYIVYISYSRTPWPPLHIIMVPITAILVMTSMIVILNPSICERKFNANRTSNVESFGSLVGQLANYFTCTLLEYHTSDARLCCSGGKYIY